MDNFARLPEDDRRLYFEQTAARLGLSAQIIEKDFWVCWTLKRLFSLEEFCGHLTFKGGPTLSKVYRVIERFSEDVDITIERGFLGFGGDNEPEKAVSSKELRRRIERLGATCQAAVVDRLQPQLSDTIAVALGGNANWNLTFDPADKNQQTLLFQYPAGIAGSLGSYFAASVKIELGARSDHFPLENAGVKPYVCDVFPQAIADAVASVQVLAATRTFWEKATILHMLHYWPKDKSIASRMSRHYYDVYRMSQSQVCEQAMAAVDLLDRVAIHKSAFFRNPAAKYEEARAGTLRLLPSGQIVDDLRRDYRAMRPMFFREPPAFDVILDHLPDLEQQINHLGR